MLNMFTFDLFIISLIYVVFVVNVVFVNRQRMFCVKVQTSPLFSCLPVFLYINLFVWFSIFVSVCLICRLLRSYGQFGLVILDISLILPYYIVVFYFFSYKLLHLFTFHPIISLAVLLAFFATFCDLKNIFFVL